MDLVRGAMRDAFLATAPAVPPTARPPPTGMLPQPAAPGVSLVIPRQRRTSGWGWTRTGEPLICRTQPSSPQRMPRKSSMTGFHISQKQLIMFNKSQFAGVTCDSLNNVFGGLQCQKGLWFSNVLSCNDTQLLQGMSEKCCKSMEQSDYQMRMLDLFCQLILL